MTEVALTPLQYDPDEAVAYLRGVDANLAQVIDRVGPFGLQPRSDPYMSILRTILFQQLAGAAATAIMKRWLALYGNVEAFPTPEQLLSTTDEEFRAAGVSRQKAGYMRDLALHVADGRLDFDAMSSLTDEEVIKALTAVKGLGEWSAHMFLMFHLGRPDVLPIGDLGVRNGMRIIYGLEATPTPAKARELGAHWAPYRSVASWYMWRVQEDFVLLEKPPES